MLSKVKIAGLMMVLTAFCMPSVYADNGDMKSAQGVHQDGDWHHAQRERMTAQILNLSEDQQKQLKESHEKQKEAMKSIAEQLMASKEAFDAEIVKATPDMNKINSIQSQIKAFLSQMADSRLNKLLEIKKIMSPEQFAGYMALEKEEDMMKHEGHDKFEHKHWGDKQDEGDKD